MAGLLLWTKKCFEFEFVGVQRAFLSERKGKVTPCTGSEDKKKARESRVESRCEGSGG